MQALQDRLAHLTNPTGSEVWAILKESEEDLKNDLVNLADKKKIAEENGRKKLEELSNKKKELANLKSEVLKCQEDYRDFVKTVKNELKKNGVDFNTICRDFEQERELRLSAFKSEIRQLLQTEGLKIPQIAENIKKTVDILKSNRDSNIHQDLEDEFAQFFTIATTKLRIELWNFLQRNKIPMKSINDTLDLTDLPDFYKKLDVFRNLSANLDYLVDGNNVKSQNRLIASFLGQITNICLDMLEKEQDFSWILTCAQNWSKNLREVVLVSPKSLSGEVYDAEFEKCIHLITTGFIQKNIKDPLIFSKLSDVLRKFDDGFDDLFVPFYQPEVLSKRIFLEVEVFSLETTKILESERCFDALDACFLGSSNVRWASELVLYFEEWIHRIDSEVRIMKNVEAQVAFYETAHVLISDLCARINETAVRLYQESTWANDVYLVMNNVWEIRELIESLTVTWPISSLELEKEYENEWDRLGGMIGEYLKEIVKEMNEKLLSKKNINEKSRTISITFQRIIKCLTNVSNKVSKSSKSALLNKLISELFIDLQIKFDIWQRNTDKDSLELISLIYSEIYENLMGYLEKLGENEWKRGEEARCQITQLDALMKVAANKDPSGELVRTAFRSIDEEQVAKMLAELGIKSTSDHAFQDYQIIAENWDKLQHNN